MSRRGIVAVGAALAGLILVAGSSADQSYSDPAGDATSGAPDIRAIRVVNDSSGTITFAVSVAGFPGSEAFVGLYLDSDRNSATGDEGIDMYFELDGSDLNTYSWCWNGSAWAGCVPASAQVDFQNGVWLVSIDDSDLGGPSSLDFFYIGFKMSGDQELGRDEAPDGTLYTYTLTQIPRPPPPPPPPPPEPEGKTYEDAPRLPSRIRYVGNSINHVRLGEKLYRTMKTLAAMKKIRVPRVVLVACWSKFDWPSVVESADPKANPASLAGFWKPRQPRWVHVAPKQCADVQALMLTRRSNGQRAYALTTVLHERVHAEGVDDEAATECYAVQLVYVFARELNFVPQKALRLEQLAVRKSRAGPRRYWDAKRCRDGEQWDIFPEFRNLTY